jgi:DNA-binding NarL/FixJ family response regulator
MTVEEKKINLLIADDHPVFRVGLLNILKKQAFIDSIHEASNGREAIDKCIKHPIDVILMDIDMPEMNGVEASRMIMEAYPQMKIIIITMMNQHRYILELYDYGVSGYVLKDASLAEISKALKLVMAGEHYYCKEISSILIKGIMDRDTNKETSDITVNGIMEELSDRESDILRLICNQYSTPEIAEKLSLSDHTIKRHRQNLMEKTQSKNLAGLVVFAMKHGIINVT